MSTVVLARLRELAERERRCREQADQLAVEIADGMRTAHQRGASWPQIGAALGISSQAARWRAYPGDDGAPPSVRARRPGASAADKAAVAPRAGKGPGVSVAEAAERLGVTPMTVYTQIARGKLRGIKDPSTGGHQRVLLDDSPHD